YQQVRLLRRGKVRQALLPGRQGHLVQHRVAQDRCPAAGLRPWPRPGCARSVLRRAVWNSRGWSRPSIPALTDSRMGSDADRVFGGCSGRRECGVGTSGASQRPAGVCEGEPRVLCGIEGGVPGGVVWAYGDRSRHSI
ncbi:hypothetical protein BGZ82_005632, partial [Podila clonocystis]